MYLIIAGVIIGGLIGWYVGYDGFSAFMGAVVGLAIGFFVAVIVAEIADVGKPDHDVVYLQNIQDNTETQGHFYLFGGSIDGVPMYSFYKETEPNTYERADIPASDAQVHYTDRRPRLVHSYKVHDNWIGPLYLDSYNGSKTDEEWDFYIPRGSITNEYRLDAK